LTNGSTVVRRDIMGEYKQTYIGNPSIDPQTSLSVWSTLSPNLIRFYATNPARGYEYTSVGQIISLPLSFNLTDPRHFWPHPPYATRLSSDGEFFCAVAEQPGGGIGVPPTQWIYQWDRETAQLINQWGTQMEDFAIDLGNNLIFAPLMGPNVM